LIAHRSIRIPFESWPKALPFGLQVMDNGYHGFSHLEIAHATEALHFADANELKYESFDVTRDLFFGRLFTAFPEKTSRFSGATSP
jgi:hypothetical protein